MDTKTVRLKRSFIFGFIALLLCGAGDWLIGYEPKGGEPLMFGISNTSIAQVPTWFYVLSLLFGILSGFGCWKFAPAILEALKDKGISESSKMYKTMKFGLASAPMMFVSFHVACCIVLLFIQASLRAGLDINSANSDFSFLTACAESWGYAFMCLAFYFAVKNSKKITK